MVDFFFTCALLLCQRLRENCQESFNDTAGDEEQPGLSPAQLSPSTGGCCYIEDTKDGMHGLWSVFIYISAASIVDNPFWSLQWPRSSILIDLGPSPSWLTRHSHGSCLPIFQAPSCVIGAISAPLYPLAHPVPSTLAYSCTYAIVTLVFHKLFFPCLEQSAFLLPSLSPNCLSDQAQICFSGKAGSLP